MPKSKFSRDNAQQYINDLSGGDIEMELERVKAEEAAKGKKDSSPSKKDTVSTAAFSDSYKELLLGINP
jgi:hypothetical protein